MKRLPNALLALLAAAIFVVPAAAPAQMPEPTPTPDPHTYSDPAMNYTAPENAVLVGRRYPQLSELGNDLAPVARWALNPGKEDQRYIDLQMEAFQGPPDQWEGQFESQAHGSGDGVLVKGKTPMSLLNGMPATFVEVTSGSGFASTKQYAVVWADGQRGIVLSLTGRIGDVTPEEAKAVLHDVTAVRYPVDEP